MCIGQIGLSHADFYECSYRDLLNIIDSFHKKELREWERVRWISYTNMLSNWSNNKKKPPSMESFMPLESDYNYKSSLSENKKHRMINNLIELQEKYNERVSLKKENIN